MKYHCGILTGEPAWDQSEALILAFTPGVPLEWIYAALRLGWRRRRGLRALVDRFRFSEFEHLGQENAKSINLGDGWNMLGAVCPGYSGPAPLWSQLDLKNSTMSNAAIAGKLGVHRETVRRWRVTNVFDPLTGCRVLPGRGGFRG